MTTFTSPSPWRRTKRLDRNIRELEHDPYHTKTKLPEPTLCPDCRAVYHAGRWQWGVAPAGAHEAVCPACRRIQEHCPAGFLTLKGGFLAAHREEILHLIRNLVEREQAEHPLRRLMRIEDQDDGSMLVTFTDPQLARAAGEAVQHAYQGELDFAYQKGEFMLRVEWQR